MTKFIASIASNLVFLMTAYSLPHPTANSQAYIVWLIQKGPPLFTIESSFNTEAHFFDRINRIDKIRK